MPDSPDKSKFVSDTFGEPLDVKRHATPERHEFGDALLTPDASDVAPVGAAGAVASAGISPKVARADHIHPFLGGGTGGVTDHGALTGLADDDHTQYLTAARGDALFLTPTEGNAAYDTIGAANAAVANHVAAADPHTVYLTQSEADALFLTPAEGNAAYSPTVHNHDAAYVNVNGDTMTAPLVLPAANPTTATQAAHKGYVDQQDSAHAGAADPHPIYLTAAEGNAAYDSLGAASTAVTNHVAAADPHTAYLKPAEVLAGTNVTVDTSTTPGSVIIAATGGSGGGLDQTTADTLYVNVPGDTMTGNLNLPAANPTAATHAAHKGYVDTVVPAHVALADPHTQYLRTSEVVAGTNLSVDTTTTPGSVILNVGVLSIVSALPGSPVDGQIIYYQNAAMAALGIVWPLRYRAAASGSYKWEAVGASPWWAEIKAQQDAAVGSAYVDFATAGPSITVPLAGDYVLEYSCFVSPPVNAGGYMSPRIGAVAASDGDSIGATAGDATGLSVSSSTQIIKTGVALNALIKLQGRSITAVCGFDSRRLSVRPIRVG